ncbi:Serine/threonine-protein kinase rio1 [Thelohanellus kitauei]|uniref:Serine/threonine-protein kinase RIO1 n=1 Tax=Thelohanellus kitauei TaxID=669202 RepID=A0A0C2J7C8_THEKT|nr:Serine/threonine-protein kinase rio1 [Thelohanellus kitauei]
MLLEMHCPFDMAEKYEDVEEVNLERYVDRNRVRLTDKSDKQTYDKVINQKVLMILRKLINTGLLSNIDGCVSSGKEANIYHAYMHVGQSAALKIYKTSILDYKNRSRYIEGEFRYRFWNYSRNPRKMVRKWAEKEFRNLSRLSKAGIPCPKPIKLCDNILIMSFLGSDCCPFPKLKDVVNVDFSELFKQCVFLMREMFQTCHLVHGDLSEYNILCDVSGGPTLYIIDVSQSVESYSPRALNFLRQDVGNISAFFRKSCRQVPSMRTIFNFITDFTLNNEELKTIWDRILVDDVGFSDNVFRDSFIPKNLSEVHNAERDIQKCQFGDCDDLLYVPLTGMAEILALHGNKPMLNSFDDPLLVGVRFGKTHYLINAFERNKVRIKVTNNPWIDELTNEPIDEFDSAWEDVDSETATDLKKNIKTKEEIKLERKANKKQVKEENREKRKTKIPKYEKKKDKKRQRKNTSSR